MYENTALLKGKLLEIKNNNYFVPGDVSPFDFALIMMKNSGSTDLELRDKLIYSVMYKWMKNGVFTNEQQTELLNLNMDNDHLFYEIGKQADDSVFKRAFSVLYIAIIISNHRNNNFLSDTAIKSVKENLIKYYYEEKDLRAHVEEKGWADSVSHGADALDEIAMCDPINHDDLLDILNVIKTKLRTNCYTYMDFEDERITTAVVSIIKRNILINSELTDWIKDFRNIERTRIYHVDFRLIMNIRNFLRSLYFRLLEENMTSELIGPIMETLTCIKTY